jgi:hypothetical protein
MSKALASSFLLILIWVVCAAFGISGSDPIPEQRSEIAYTQFKRIVGEGLVSDVFLRGNRIEGTLILTSWRKEPRPCGAFVI